MPVKTGIQNLLKILDSPVSSTGQALRRAALARNDKNGDYDTVSMGRWIPVATGIISEDKCSMSSRCCRFDAAGYAAAEISDNAKP